MGWGGILLKKIKSILGVLSICIFCSIVGGCSNETEISEKQIRHLIQTNIQKNTNNQVKKTISGDKKNIVFVGKSEGDKFIEEIDKAVEKECNSKGYNFKKCVSENSLHIVNDQIETLKELYVAKVDGIILVPSSSTQLIPILKKIQDAKIPLVVVDTAIDNNESLKNGLLSIPFITIDNEKLEYDITKKIVDDMVSTKINIKPLIITGDLTGKNAVQRRDGAVRALNEKGVTSVAIEDGKWRISNGYYIAKKKIIDSPDINLIICGNDEMALGVVQYLKEINKKDIKVLGFDANKRAVQAVKKGDIKVTVKQNSNEMGKVSVDTLINLISGKSQSNLINIDAQIINASNVD